MTIEELSRDELLRLARILFECGFGYEHIRDTLGLSIGTLHRHSQSEGWVKAKHLGYIKSSLQAKELALRLDKQELGVADSIVECIEKNKELVLSITVEASKLAQDILKKNKKRTIVKVSKGVANGEELQVVEEELDLKDLKDAIELADKASVTLGINPRFASAVKIDTGETKVIAPFASMLKQKPCEDSDGD